MKWRWSSKRASGRPALSRAVTVIVNVLPATSFVTGASVTRMCVAGETTAIRVICRDMARLRKGIIAEPDPMSQVRKMLADLWSRDGVPEHDGRAAPA
jgi:hypothetical protein